MKHRLLFAAAAAALLAPSIAVAQDSGVYLRGQAGYGIFTDADLSPDDDQFGTGFNGEVVAEGNGALSLGIGYDYGNNWRVELGVDSLYNDLGAIGEQIQSSAKLRTTSYMLNALYDFDDFGRWEPYVGAGVGFTEGKANLTANDFPSSSNTVIRNPACVTAATSPTLVRACDTDSSDSVFSWNLIAGLGYKITERLHWDTNYKYTNMGDFDFDGTVATISAAGQQQTNPLSTDLDDVASHTILTGFRYRFGAVTPPVPATVLPMLPIIETFTCSDGTTEVTDLTLCPPELVTCSDGFTQVTDLALCPPTMVTCPDGVTRVSDLAACPIVQVSLCEPQYRQEIIYYEFDKGQSAETRNTINRLLDIGQFCQVDNIRVVGHTDTSGPASYNVNLSNRRAADARSELVRQGVSEAIVTSEGKGETEPFVQTGDGVREQLNRRTEVLMTISEVANVVN